MKTWSLTAECPDLEALFISAGADLGDLTGVPAVGATDVLWQTFPGLKQVVLSWGQIDKKTLSPILCLGGIANFPYVW
jgi:hypothetical protein